MLTRALDRLARTSRARRCSVSVCLVFVSVFVADAASTVSTAFAFFVAAGAASASASAASTSTGSASPRVRLVDLECGLECSVLDSSSSDSYASARNLPSPYAERMNASLASSLNARWRNSVDFRVSFASFFSLLCAGVGTTSGG